jgi:hypothetical protein
LESVQLALNIGEWRPAPLCDSQKGMYRRGSCSAKVYFRSRITAVPASVLLAHAGDKHCDIARLRRLDWDLAFIKECEEAPSMADVAFDGRAAKLSLIQVGAQLGNPIFRRLSSGNLVLSWRDAFLDESSGLGDSEL